MIAQKTCIFDLFVWYSKKCSDRRFNWKIKQECYAAFTRVLSYILCSVLFRWDLAGVWHKHTRTKSLNRVPILAMGSVMFLLATPTRLILVAKTCETQETRKQKAKRPLNNNQIKVQANETKRKYYRCLHRGKPTHTVILSSEFIRRIRKIVLLHSV